MMIASLRLRRVAVVLPLLSALACNGKTDLEVYRSLKASLADAESHQAYVRSRLDSIKSAASRDTALQDLVKDVSSLTPAEYARILTGTVTEIDTPQRAALRKSLREFADSLEFAAREERVAKVALLTWLGESTPQQEAQGNRGVLIAAFLGALTAMIGTWIAWQQHKATRSKLRLDLYDRRFSVAEGINKLLSKAVTNAKIEMPDLHAYNADTAHAQFLFDSDFFAYVEEIRTRAIDFRVNAAQLAQIALVPPALREGIIARDLELLNWFTAQFGQYRTRLAKYIQFKDAL